MAIYSTFFACRPDDLRAAFPGWRPPLAVPVQREYRNPFTRQVVVVTTQEPSWDDDDPGAGPPHASLIEMTGDYAAYLEARVPVAVRERPHWCAKGLTQIEIDELGQALGVDGSPLEDALFAPPSWGKTLQRLGPAFVDRLAAVRGDGVAADWAARMSAPEHTRSMTGAVVADPWSVDDVGPLVDLARGLAAGSAIYLLVEA